MNKREVLELIDKIAKANGWSTRIVNDSSTISPFLLIQKIVCELIFYSDRDDELDVCFYPVFDDVPEINRFDKRGDNWFISGVRITQEMISQLLEDIFRGASDRPHR
jgi:hypothetical protein